MKRKNLKKKRGKYVIDPLEIIQGIRKSWGNVNPITRVIPSKKIYNRKEKHKEDIL